MAVCGMARAGLGPEVVPLCGCPCLSGSTGRGAVCGPRARRWAGSSPELTAGRPGGLTQSSPGDNGRGAMASPCYL